MLNRNRIRHSAAVAILCLLLAGVAAADRWESATDAFPVKGAWYVSTEPVNYTTTYIDVEMVSMTLLCRDPGEVVEPSILSAGKYDIDSFFDVFTELSVDSAGGGGYFIESFFDVFAELSVDIPTGYGGATGVIQTEIVAMELSSDVAGTTVILRESPTLQSSGQATITDIGGGLYHIDSFFDVFTELSVDGGASWIVADGAIHMELIPEPATFALLGLGALGLLRKRKP